VCPRLTFVGWMMPSTYLGSISEPRDNSVFLRVQEAVNYSSVARVPDLGDPISKLLEGATPIE